MKLTPHSPHTTLGTVLMYIITTLVFVSMSSKIYIMGDSWVDNAYYIRSVLRNGDSPDICFYSIGFRLYE